MRHFKTAWQHITRAPYQALSAVSIMTLTFFIASVFVSIAFASQVILHYFETRPQVTAFFKDQVTQDQVEALKTRLTQNAEVSQVKYVSKDEALNIYRDQNKNDPLLLEMVTANILPASLEVSTVDLTSLKQVAQTLKEQPGVEEVIFQEDVVTSLSAWIRALRIGGAGLVGFLVMISFLTVMVIIGMKVALRKNEIEILRLIGASSWYVRAPFILEGMIYGVGGAVTAGIFTYLLILYSTPFLTSFLAGIPLLPVSPLFIAGLFLSLIISGAIIGSLSSLIATRRYLR